MVKQHRASNFELLRIVCTLLIIAGHLTNQSGILDVEGITVNKSIAIILGSAFGIADNVFVMIGAWFLVDKEFKTERITKLYLQIATYVIPITVFMIIFHKSYMGLKEIVRGLFPWGGSPLWFGTVYIEMLLLTPFLNVLLSNIKRTKLMLILLFVINTIPASFLFRNDFFYSGELVWFCFIYLLMGYIKKSKIDSVIKRKPCFFGTVGIYFMLLIIYFGTEYLSSMSGQFEKMNASLLLSTYYIDRYHTIPNFFCSIFLFFIFQKTEIKYNWVINGISKGCFGIYIFHQAPGFTKFMWSEIFKTQKWTESKFYVVYFVGTVLMIFVAGSIVDLIRRKYFEKIINAGKLSEAINQTLAKLYSDF